MKNYESMFAVAKAMKKLTDKEYLERMERIRQSWGENNPRFFRRKEKNLDDEDLSDCSK